MEDKVTLEMSGQEAQALLQLLDVAVKAGGLNVVDAASFFKNKLTPPKPKEE